MSNSKIKNCPQCKKDFDESLEGQDIGFGIVGHTACINKANEAHDEARKGSSSSARPPRG